LNGLPARGREIPLESASVTDLVRLFVKHVPADDATTLEDEDVATCLAVCKELRNRGREKAAIQWIHYSQVLTFDLQDAINRVQVNRANSRIQLP
jgi:hypothetical protein